MKLAVNEMFGPTIQGEGPSVGEPAAFLRVAGCNQACVWCDTPYTWDYKRFAKIDEVQLRDPVEAALELQGLLPPGSRPLIVVTGGEPMLQQTALAQTLIALRVNVTTEPRVEVETAGTRVPLHQWDLHVNRYNVSLKLEHSGNARAIRHVPEAIEALRDSGKAVWKFVVQEPDQLTEVQGIVDAYHLDPVFIMPEGVTSDVLLRRARELAPFVIHRGWRMTPRLHIDLWGAVRGR